MDADAIMKIFPLSTYQFLIQYIYFFAAVSDALIVNSYKVFLPPARVELSIRKTKKTKRKEIM
jgi:hypothetical protein